MVNYPERSDLRCLKRSNTTATETSRRFHFDAEQGLIEEQNLRSPLLKPRNKFGLFAFLNRLRVHKKVNQQKKGRIQKRNTDSSETSTVAKFIAVLWFWKKTTSTKKVAEYYPQPEVESKKSRLSIRKSKKKSSFSYYFDECSDSSATFKSSLDLNKKSKSLLQRYSTAPVKPVSVSFLNDSTEDILRKVRSRNDVMAKNVKRSSGIMKRPVIPATVDEDEEVMSDVSSVFSNGSVTEYWNPVQKL